MLIQIKIYKFQFESDEILTESSKTVQEKSPMLITTHKSVNLLNRKWNLRKLIF